MHASSRHGTPTLMSLPKDVTKQNQVLLKEILPHQKQLQAGTNEKEKKVCDHPKMYRNE